uniref:Uncharacterized protein TCIL3000_3_880 n=1 Tax=Trypanosoma congolense (strain IL3000) TaxID=1068625 RepID=G0UJV9_TRYCI|nr:unnamed protein product [Trypanosoma congolense IL3000]
MLSQYLRRRVSVVTVDGRYLVGVLHAADQLMNVVLTSCVERTFDDTGDASTQVGSSSGVDDPNEGGNTKRGTVQEQQLGVMMIRGSDVVCIASVNTIEEAKLSMKDWRGRNLPPVQRVARLALQ